MSEAQFKPLSMVLIGTLTSLSAVVLLVAAIGGSYWLNHETQIAQQKQGLVIEYRLCRTLDALAGLAPPPGSALTNPSRAYEQQEHVILAELKPDLGCTG